MAALASDKHKLVLPVADHLVVIWQGVAGIVGRG